MSKKSDLRDERLPKLLGIFFIFLAVYLTVAFISYLTTWSIDQDSVLRFSWSLLFEGDIEVANRLGRLGAILSNMFFYWGFGVASFLFIYLLIKYGITLIKGEPIGIHRIALRNTLVLIVFLSIFFRFLFYSSEFPWGGAFGDAVCTWMMNFVGTVGMIVLLLAMIIGLITWFFNPNYQELTYEKAMTETKGYFSDLFNSRYRSSNTAKQTAANITKRNYNKEKEAEASGDKVLINSTVYKSLDALIAPEEATKAPVAKATEPVNPNAPVTFDLNKELLPSANTNILTPKNREPIETSAGTDLEIEIANVAKSDLFDEPSVPTPASVAPKMAETKEKVHFDVSTPYDPTLDLSVYEHPVLMLLEDYAEHKVEVDRAELEANKEQIISTLLNYKIEIVKIRATIGPTVTLYEIVPAPGVRISRIKSLEDDIALSLAALGIRIIAPIPGRGTIGIEVPNKNKQIVALKEVLQSERFKRSDMDLPIALGKTISNEVFVADLAKMPHLLIAGATGQGKSVGINAILMSLLYRKHPSQVKLVLIDPKKVELFPYSQLENHFLAFLPDQDEPIITDTNKVINTLNSLCIEMDARYDLLKKASSRNIREYNEKFVARQLNPNNGHRFLPFIVLIIDEFADLIMTAGKEVELPIGRLAQLARAIGIHLIIATQRPSVNIITGVIKANFPARIAYKVTSKIDSRTILDTGGAEQLIGRGDMLLSIGGDMIRLQSAFVDTPEVERVIDFIAKQQGYPEPYFLPEFRGNDDGGDGFGKDNINVSDLDEMLEDAARLVVQNQHGSTSMIQRRLKLGYNRAGRIMDQLEALGIVGPNEGSKPREVLFYDEQELESFLQSIKSRK